MIDFCPDGYLPALKVVAAAAQRWFAERFTQLENATVSQQETDSESSIEKAVRIFSQPPIPDDWRQALEEIKNETVHRLRIFCMKVSCTATISTRMDATRFRANSGLRPKPMASWSAVSIGHSAGQADCMSSAQIMRCSYCNRNWTHF